MLLLLQKNPNTYMLIPIIQRINIVFRGNYVTFLITKKKKKGKSPSAVFIHTVTGC